MNKQEIERIRTAANRTLLIVQLIEQGNSLPEVITYSKAKRQLCEYYFKKINPRPGEEEKE
jgi:hypothetical protein